MITLTGTSNSNDANRKKYAFPLPGTTDTVCYLESDPDPKYQGYLVKVTTFDDSKIDFKGVNLSSGNVSETTRTVYFKEMTTIWLPAPSSELSNWSLATNCCIILFLADGYTTGKQDLLDARGTGGKWPKGSGLTILTLHEKVQKLEKTVDDLKPHLHDLMNRLSDHDKQHFAAKFAAFLG